MYIKCRFICISKRLTSISLNSIYMVHVSILRCLGPGIGGLTRDSNGITSSAQTSCGLRMPCPFLRDTSGDNHGIYRKSSMETNAEITF